MERTLLHKKEVNSTNEYLRSLLKQGWPTSPIAVYADYQEKGKGQRGNHWESEGQKNVLLSILVSDFIHVTDLYTVNLASVLSVAEVLESYHIKAKIKWPNDVFVNDEKIAGCLIENALEGDQIKYCVVGIGLNVNQKYFPKFSACSMQTVTNKEHDRLEIIKALCSQLDKNIALQADELLRKVNERLYKAGEMVTFANERSKETYQVLRMMPNGNLKVARGNHELELQHHLIKWQW